MYSKCILKKYISYTYKPLFIYNVLFDKYRNDYRFNID